ncbi:MAG: TlpA disulfide reductase family protein [Bacteroidales bacterium]|nr:TlpA disulfide reductase family protein [Bacteroidales bacterium]
MKRILGSLISVLLLVSCTNTKTFKIKGQIDKASDKMLYLEQVGISQTEIIDSVKISADGDFKFKEKRPENAPEFYRLRLNNQVINLSIDSTETIEVKSNLKDFAQNYSVAGSKNCTDIQQLNQMGLKTKIAVDSLFKLKEKGVMEQAQFEESVMQKLAEYKKVASRIIFANPKSAAAYFALFQRVYSFLIFDPSSSADIRVFGAVATSYDTFYPKNPRSIHLKEFTLQAMAAMRKNKEVYIPANELNSVGSLEIELPDIHGSVKKLSLLKGKVVVLSFTAYQTQFSPTLNMLLGEIYQAKKANGLEIYQVSLDDDENFWKVSAAHLPWVCVRDISGSRTSIAQMYNVREIPTIFLINKNGDVEKRILDPKNLKSEIDKLL